MDPEDYFRSFLSLNIPVSSHPFCSSQHRDQMPSRGSPKGEAITGEPQYVLMVEPIELGGLIQTHGSTNVHLELI